MPHRTNIENELIEAKRLFEVFKTYCKELKEKYEFPITPGVYMEGDEMRCIVLADIKLLHSQLDALEDSKYSQVPDLSTE